MKISLLVALPLTALFLSMIATNAKTARPEVGLVQWQRDFDAALAESKTSGKPVFAFFQEVPG